MNPVTLLGADAPLDRQSGRRGDQYYLQAIARGPNARFLLVLGLDPLVRVGSAFARRQGDDAHLIVDIDQPRPPRSDSQPWIEPTEIATAGLDPTAGVFLGVTPGTADGHFALRVSQEQVDQIGRRFPLMPITDLRTLASTGALDAADSALAALARALFAWHDSARHCGWCGTPTTAIDGGWKRHCAPCGKDAFPRVDPVVIMLVTDGERCVLAHEPRYPTLMYSTLAGFIEPGETIAHAVIRETAEEVGLHVDRVTVAASQPWPFPHSLMIGATAHVSPHRPNVFTLDPTEIVDARWFTRAEASRMLARTHESGLWLPGPQAIAHHLVRAWVEGAQDSAGGST